MSTTTRKDKAFAKPPAVVATAGALQLDTHRLTNAEILRAAQPGCVTDTHWASLQQHSDLQAMLQHVARDTAERLAGAASALTYMTSFFAMNDRHRGMQFIAASLRDQSRLLAAAVGAIEDSYKAEDATAAAQAEARAVKRRVAQ
jgi:hypothetical protein